MEEEEISQLFELLNEEELALLSILLEKLCNGESMQLEEYNSILRKLGA